MKRYISLLTLLVLVASIFAFAGGDHAKKMSVDEKVSWMAKELNLTSDQQASLKPILENQQKQIDAIWSDSSLTDEAKKAKKMEIKSSTNAQINALLNSEQQAKFASMQQANKKETMAKQ